MKILVLWDYYDSYFPYFYKTHPGVEALSYADHLEEIKNDFFYWPPYLVPWFNHYGHEAELIIGNCKPLQSRWAREHGYDHDEARWHIDIVTEQIKAFKPDIIFLGGYTDIYIGEFMSSIKEYCRRIVAWKAASVSRISNWSDVDLVLTSHNNFVEYFRKNGICSERVLPCFEPNILQRIPARSPSIDMSFIGTLSPILFSRRMKILSELLQRLPISVFSEKPVFRRRPWPLRQFFKQFSFIPFALSPKICRPVYGLDMYSTLRKSKLSLNIHVDSAQGLAGNIRMFEATGVGTLLLTEQASNLGDFFVSDKELITYTNTKEIIDKAQYYISHMEARETIAQAGQKRTLKDHNPRVRALEILDIFSRYLRKKDSQ